MHLRSVLNKKEYADSFRVSADCSTEFQCKCIGVLSQTHQHWNSVLQSAELDSAADFRAAASIGKQGFGDV